MSRNSVLFVLGAADSEMAAIEVLFQAAGVSYAYAAHQAKDGRLVRVHPGVAYQATHLLFPGGAILVPYPLPDGEEGGFEGELVVVECNFPGVTPIEVIDHHRSGDPGWGVPPERFLIGSSIGQVLLHLAEQRSPPWDEPARWECHSTPDGVVQWRICHQSYPVDSGGLGEDHFSPGQAATPEQLLIAAADHCLEAAYRGCCPGVDPDGLMAWRAESRAAFQRRAVAAVLRDVEAARGALLAAEAMDCGPDGTSDFQMEGETPVHANVGRLLVRDLRGQDVPELPEAACREGIPYLSEVVEPGGRRKVVLGAASPELVRLFRAGKVVPGLVDRYDGGDARGYAGGYLP